VRTAFEHGILFCLEIYTIRVSAALLQSFVSGTVFRMKDLCLRNLDLDDPSAKWGQCVVLHSAGIPSSCFVLKPEWDCLIVQLPRESDAAQALEKAIDGVAQELNEKTQGSCGGLGGIALAELKTPVSEYNGMVRLRLNTRSKIAKDGSESWRVGVVNAPDGSAAATGKQEVQVLGGWHVLEERMDTDGWKSGAERVHMNITFRLYCFTGKEGNMVRGISASPSRPRDVEKTGRPALSVHIWQPSTDPSRSGLCNTSGQAMTVADTQPASGSPINFDTVKQMQETVISGAADEVGKLGRCSMLSGPGFFETLSLERGAYAGAGRGFNTEHKNCTSYLHTNYPADSFFGLSGDALLMRSKYERTHSAKKQKTEAETESVYFPWSVSYQLDTEEPETAEDRRRLKTRLIELYSNALRLFYEKRAELTRRDGADGDEIAKAAENMKRSSWERDAIKWACVDDPDVLTGDKEDDDDAVPSTLVPIKYGSKGASLMVDIENDTAIVWQDLGQEPRLIQSDELDSLFPHGVCGCEVQAALKCRLYMKMEVVKRKKDKVIKCTDPRVKFKAAALWVKRTAREDTDTCQLGAVSKFGGF
jgi:hypothetical protein